jgi:formate-dependent nitrite reductase membrane component NrfD
MSNPDINRASMRPPEDQKRAPMWDAGRRRGRGEQMMVPRATFSSYYGRPVLKKPVWEERDIAGYLFTGGIAAGSAVLAAGADRTGLPTLRRVTRLSSMAALGVSGVALVHDLGRPERFYNMLRVFKPTSPMSVGSWILTAFALPTAVTFADEVPGLLPSPLRGLVRRLSPAAGVGAAVLGSGVATYTAVLLSDTAVPSWHAAYPELPFVFAGSALSGSAGLALLLAPCAESRPAQRLAFLGAAVELAASQRIEQRLGLLAEPYRTHPSGRKMKTAKALTLAGVVASTLFGRRSRTMAVVSGAALLGASALTRFAIFEAGVTSTEDPAYTVVPQRERLEQRGPSAARS